jgi:hypothetical protein
MEEHGEVDKIFDGGNVRDRGGDGRSSISEEGILFSPFCDSDISIDRVFIVDDVELLPLRSD